MWYGSLVLRQGRSRPCRRYHPRSRRLKRRRSGGVGIGSFVERFDVVGVVNVCAAQKPQREAALIIRTGPVVKLYTKTGDTGETSLFDGTRVSKADDRVDAYGEVDELNAWLGLVRGFGLDPDLSAVIVEIQRDLFAVGAELADPRHKIAARVTKAAIGDEEVQRLEATIDRLETALSPLTRFILPGGPSSGAALHVSRTVCRRAERRVVALQPPVDPVIVRYLNRLSDLLFVLARLVNHRAKVPETEW
jgi:cob(I)alamin adenosyltransferase